MFGKRDDRDAGDFVCRLVWGRNVRETLRFLVFCGRNVGDARDFASLIGAMFVIRVFSMFGRRDIHHDEGDLEPW